MSALDSAVENLVKRLETVTSRLEAVEKQIASGAASGASASSSSAAAPAGDASASVADYNDLISTYIQPLVTSTQAIGSDELKKQVDLVLKAVNAQRDMLAVAAASKKPAQDVLVKIITPTSTLMQEIGAIRDANRKSKQFNHLSTLSEGISALGWVMVEPTPGPFVNESRGSSEFYSNKILVEFKKTDQAQVDWVSHWNNFMKELFTYIKKHHTTGLAWNPRGGDASAAPAAAPVAAAPKGAGPPPPAPKIPLAAAAPAAASGPSPTALFSELNKGAAITSGLKKVTKDMKNKYDPSKSSLVPADAAVAKKPAAAAPKATAVKKGTPKFELSGNKWIVEWQEGNQDIVISETELKQTVYIYKCERSVIRIQGKVNSITIDGCKRVSVVFDDALALCEVVNSTSIEVQSLGRVPSMTVDKCSGVQLYVSKAGLDVELVTSKSDAMNVLIPDPAGGLDPIEIAVPEQFKTTIKDGKLHTSTLEHV